MKKLIFIITIFSIIFLFFYNKNLISTPITTISLESNIIYSNKKNLDIYLDQYFGVGIYDVDLRKIKYDIEQDPWIKSARIILEPPDKIIINIYEYNPLFLWNNKHYIDIDGILFKTNTYPIKNILKISSNSDSYIDMYNLYLSLESMLSEINLSINAINKNDDMIDILTPTYRFYVRKSQYKTKLKEFVDIYDQFLTLNPNKKNFKIIDLRYPTGFAVQ